MSNLNEQILDAWIQLTTVINNDRIVSTVQTLELFTLISEIAKEELS